MDDNSFGKVTTPNFCDDSLTNSFDLLSIEYNVNTPHKLNGEEESISPLQDQLDAFWPSCFSSFSFGFWCNGSLVGDKEDIKTDLDATTNRYISHWLSITKNYQNLK